MSDLAILIACAVTTKKVVRLSIATKKDMTCSAPPLSTAFPQRPPFLRDFHVHSIRYVF